MGAAISYYTVFSIAPLLLIVIAVAGFVWGREAVQGEIVGQLSGLIGRDGALGIQALIESAHKPAKGLLATAISLGVLVVGATTVFAELQSALDRVWDAARAENHRHLGHSCAPACCRSASSSAWAFCWRCRWSSARAWPRSAAG